MARLFGGAGTDKVSLGSPAALDDLTASGQTMMVAVGRLNASPVAGSEPVIASKSSFIWDILAGANDRKMAFIIDRPTDTVVACNTQLPLNTHVCVGVNFDASFATGNAGVTFLGNSLELPLTVFAATTLAAGSGTIVSDAASDLIVGNHPAGGHVWKGDLGWFVEKKKAGATPWSLKEFRDVQAGILLCKAARDAGRSIARGLALINSGGAASLILEIAASGTVTDHSANALTATLTGTTAGTEQPDWHEFQPGGFYDDLEPENASVITDQTFYPYTTEFARKDFDTPATAFTLWGYSTAAPLFADDRVNQLGYLIDGVYTDEIRSAAAQTYLVDSRSGLSGSPKTLTFMAGLRATSDGSRPYFGTWPILVWFNAAATESAPITRSTPLVVIGDSWMEGFYVPNAAQQGCLQKLRLNLPSMYDGLIMYGGGGLALHDVGADATARQNLADMLCAPNPAAILFSLAGNDWFTDSFGPVANFSAALSDQIDKLKAGFAGHIYVVGIADAFPVGSPYEGDNAEGDSADDYSAAIAAVCATKGSRVTFLSLAGVVDPADFDVDLLHPNEDGHDALYQFFADEVTGVSITVQDATHAHTADSPALTQANVLVAADALHAHAADSPALTQANQLVPQDALHGHTAESPALVQANVLAPADAVHAHTADNVGLVFGALLEVADALHIHITDSPTLVAEQPDHFPSQTWTAAARSRVYVAPRR